MLKLNNVCSKLDQTTINLLTILISGAGLFSVMTKFYSPEVNYSFLGENPFLVKRDIIESILSWVFTSVGFLGLLLQVHKEICADKIIERKYKARFYFKFFGLGFMAMLGIVFILSITGNAVARQIWQPRIVDSQKEVFESASFIVKYDGWRKDQLDVKDKLDDPKKYIEANIKTAADNILQIEKLLDIRSRTNSLSERIEGLNKYFVK
jgi:hypothetical protein